MWDGLITNGCLMDTFPHWRWTKYKIFHHHCLMTGWDVRVLVHILSQSPEFQNQQLHLSPARDGRGSWPQHQDIWRNSSGWCLQQWWGVALLCFQYWIRSEVHRSLAEIINGNAAGMRLTGFVHAEDHYWEDIGGGLGYFSGNHKVYKSIALGRSRTWFTW